jgi:hypothetical protein
MFHADLSRLAEDPLTLAVGWLEPEHPHAKGPLDERFIGRLMELLIDPWQPAAAAGLHRCGFCRFSGGPGSVRYAPERGGSFTVVVGAANLYVPGRDGIYVAPSLIAHYIDAHEYLPPREFVDAVCACPDMRSAAYLRAIREVGGATLLREARNAAYPRAAVTFRQPCSACGATVEVVHGQSGFGGRLRYSAGHRCPCGAGQELDGDTLPDDIRAVFYAEHGRWSPHVIDPGPNVVLAARRLADARKLAPLEALKLLKIAGAELLEGTNIETAWLQAQLEPLGVRTNVRPR